MNYTIENDKLKVVISDLGAELLSIYGKTTNFEYLWQGDPAIWTGRAPIMFPICGRLNDNKYLYDGKEYQMLCHGFAKKSVFTVSNQSEISVTFTLRANDFTLAQYPFNFDFSVIYTLDGANLKTNFLVSNLDRKDMYFSIGGHPGFNIPLVDGADFSEHYVEFEKAKKITTVGMADDSLLYIGEKPYSLESDKILRLKHSLFDIDGVFLTGIDNSLKIKCDKAERFVKLDYKDITHLGVWHKPKTTAPYVCIEPWHGVPSWDKEVDDITLKREMIKLLPNQKYDTFINITVNE